MPASRIVNRLKQAYWNWLVRRANDGDPGQLISPHPWMDSLAMNLETARASSPLAGKTDNRVIYVDGGAYDGTMARRFLKRFPNLEVHAFEPIVETHEKLVSNLANVPGAIYPLALAQESGKVTIHYNKAPGTCSVLPRGPYSEVYFNHATTPIEERQVRATSLDDWFAASGLERVDILKLDLQGLEGRVLKGAPNLLDSQIPCVFLEVMFVAEYEGCSLFGDLDAILRSHGYRLFNLYNLSTHSDRQLSCADALYIPDRPVARSAARAA
ncbi:MAG: FkbM family methyltransferase [Planctomycetota bacterium]|nr:FkbM family methyltransferase [Planctomycetota bacterium]